MVGAIRLVVACAAGRIAGHRAGDRRGDPREPEAGFQDADERVAYEVATEIMATKELSQAGYDKAVAQFGQQGTVDLISTIGYYAMVGIFLKSLRRAVRPTAAHH